MLNTKEPVETESLKKGGSDWWNQFLEEMGRKWAPGPETGVGAALWPLYYTPS